MFQPIIDRLQDVENAFQNRTGFRIWVEFVLNDSPFAPAKVKLLIESKANIDYPDIPTDLQTFDDVLDALDDIEHWISTLPDHETVAKTTAVKNLGQALDQCKDAGIDTTAFDEPFRNIYDNLLPAC